MRGKVFAACSAALLMVAAVVVCFALISEEVGMEASSPNNEAEAENQPLEPDDFPSEEEYEKALIDSAAPQIDVPEEVVEYEDGSGGFVKGMLVIYADYAAGKEAVKQLVESLGGVWVSDMYSWPASSDSGRAIVDAYFPSAETKDDLMKVAEQLEESEQIETVSLDFWSNDIAFDDESSAASLLGYAVNDPDAAFQTFGQLQ